MSIYHKDKCSKEVLTQFRQKVIDFLEAEGLIPHKIKALRSYNGEIRIYKAEPALRLRMRTGRRLVAFKNPNGSYAGNASECNILKQRGGDSLYERTTDPISCANYTQVFRTDNWEEEKQAIRDFFRKEIK